MKSILRQTFESTWRPHVTAASAEHYISTDIDGRLVDEHGTSMLVALIDRQVAGLVFWRLDFIESLHVGDGFRRSGVGKALLRAVEPEITRAGFAAARLQTDTFNATSRAFYERQGYVEADRYPDTEWNSDLTTILFVKPLSQ